jgi:hypothetical protein
MKKLISLPIILIAFYFTSNAQTVRIGFTGGVSLANNTAKFDDETQRGKTVAGITAGMLVDIPAGNHFSFQPAINFVQKGTKEEETFDNSVETLKLTVNSIEVPLNFLYNTRGESGNFFIGAGPSVAFAVSGKVKAEEGGEPTTMKLKFGNGDEDNLRGMDMGANFVTGYTFSNGLSLTANYNKGLNNLLPGGESSGGTLKSHYFGIKLGFLLGGRK